MKEDMTTEQMTTEELIEVLSGRDPCYECENGGCKECHYNDYRKQAATRLESFSASITAKDAEIARLTAELSESKTAISGAKHIADIAGKEIRRLNTALAESQRRERAATSALRDMVSAFCTESPVIDQDVERLITMNLDRRGTVDGKGEKE